MDVLYIIIALINGLSSIVTIIGNGLVFVAIVKTQSLHTPTNVLLCSLAASDFAVGLVVQPLFIVERTDHGKNKILLLMMKYSQIYFNAVSFTTMVFISLDRFLALHWHLRYPVMVTVQHVRNILVIVWVSLVPVVVILFNVFRGNNRNDLIIIFLIISSCIILLCHFQIYKIVKRHRRQISAQRQAFTGPTPFQGRSIRTMWYIQGLYVICVLPLLTANLAIRVFSIEKNMRLVLKTASKTILFMNSSLNPYLYCYRSTGIKNIVLTMVRSCLCKMKGTDIELGKVTELRPQERKRKSGDLSKGIRPDGVLISR